MKTKPVGFWIVGVDVNTAEITKWGKDGGTALPLPPDTKPSYFKKEIDWMKKRLSSHDKLRFYIFKVFATGQMVHYYATENAGL